MSWLRFVAETLLILISGSKFPKNWRKEGFPRRVDAGRALKNSLFSIGEQNDGFAVTQALFDQILDPAIEWG